MFKMKKFKKYVVFLVILLILSSSLRVFPTYAHEDDTIEMFSFKTINDYYLCAEEGGGSTLTADRQDIGSWEKFQLIDRGKGYVAIKSHNGYYLGALKDEENILVKANKIGKSQLFKLIKLDNDKVRCLAPMAPNLFRNFAKDILRPIILNYWPLNLQFIIYFII